MTWLDVKTATLQKMYAISGDTIVLDESTIDYIKAMPYAANEALQLLSTAGKYITKSVQIAINPIPNLVPNAADSNNIVQHLYEDIAYEASGAKAYTFEVMGPATIEILKNNIVVKTITVANDSPTTYKTYKGLIGNADNEPIKLLFKGLYAYAINNVALYGVSFPTEFDVPEYALQKRYKLRDIASDFYKLKTENVVFEGSQEDESYKATENYYWEGNDTIVIDRERAGKYTIYYYAYPPLITSATLDSYELPLDPL